MAVENKQRYWGESVNRGAVLEGGTYLPIL